MTCFFCNGETEKSTTTYMVDLDNCIIVIKNVPCNKCKQCGEPYFDNDVAKRIDEIVNKIKDAVTKVAIVEYSPVA